jgi:hypothetical protein
MVTFSTGSKGTVGAVEFADWDVVSVMSELFCELPQADSGSIRQNTSRNASTL